MSSIQCSIHGYAITTIIFIFFVIVLITEQWLNTRIGYFSLHLSEYTLIPYFWDLHSESFFNYFPRHGLQEVLLGKLLLKLKFDIYQTGYLAEFLIKTATILDLMAIIYWLRKCKLYLPSIIILYTIVLFYFVIAWQVGTHIFLLTLPFFFYEKTLKINIFLRILLLAFVNISIFFLRWDYGLFAMIASSIIFFIDNKNFKLIIIYILFLAIFLQIYLQFLNSNLIEFINFMWVLKNNTAVWGWPDIVSQMRTPYILMNFFISAYLIYVLFKNREEILKEYSFIYLMLLSLFNILVLCGRSDGHVYFAGILFTLIPIFLIFYRNQHFFDRGKITLGGVFILLIPLFIMLNDSTIKKNSINFNFTNAISIFKSFPTSNQLWPYSNESKNQIFNLAKNPLFKDKISFIPMSPFEYVIFDTKPVSNFSDLYHASQTKDLNNTIEILEKSEIIILTQKTNIIDGYPLKERFQEAFEYLDNNFTPIFNDDQIIIYKKL